MGICEGLENVMAERLQDNRESLLIATFFAGHV